MKAVLIILTILCLIAFAPLCFSSADEAEVPAYGDAVVVGSIGDAVTLVPILASDSASQEIVGLVFNGLVKYDENMELTGELARSWEILDEGRTIIFRLRPDVKWQDGKPFTAADVRFTYEKLIDPKTATPYSGDFERIESLEVLDDWTVRVRYKEPFAPALASWGMWIIPKHLLDGEDLRSTEFARAPIGTGPYIFKEWNTDEKIVLEANPEYFEHQPYIRRYIWRVIPDQATLFLELRANGVDYIGLTPLQWKLQTDTKFFRSNYRKFRYPAFGYTYIGYNLTNPKFKDKRVRQALNYAIDKEKIIDGVLLGLGRVCTGPFVPESWAFNKEVEPVKYDIEKAKALLEEAGWTDTDGDGILDRDGIKFEWTLITNQGNEQRRLTAEIVQRELALIGIKMKIKMVEWSAFVSEFIDKRRFEAVLLGWGLSRDPDSYDIWHSSKTGEREFNFVGYSNQEVDRLLKEGRRTFERSKRQAIYRRIHRILYEDQPYTFLYVADALPVVSSRFKGIKETALGIGYNFIDWYVPKKAQRYKMKIQN